MIRLAALLLDATDEAGVRVRDKRGLDCFDAARDEVAPSSSVPSEADERRELISSSVWVLDASSSIANVWSPAASAASTRAASSASSW